eukprot:Tamp_04849.p1 GENE.Tamp_04849~~Tamp_04849.p1  ORF type:complete len:440 (-),score=70.68 Tamp_04849:310-1629(-)
MHAPWTQASADNQGHHHHDAYHHHRHRHHDHAPDPMPYPRATGDEQHPSDRQLSLEDTKQATGNAELAANTYVRRDSIGRAQTGTVEKQRDEHPSSSQKKKSESEKRKRKSQRSWFSCFTGNFLGGRRTAKKERAPDSHELRESSPGYPHSPRGDTGGARETDTTPGLDIDSPSNPRQLFPVHTPSKVGGADAHRGGDRSLQERLTYWDLEEARTEKDLMMLAEERSGVAMQGFGAGRGEGASGFVKADIDLSGHHLAARDMSFLHGRSSDPYVSLLQGGLLVATTEVVPHNLNPVWKTLTVNVRHDLPVKIKCWDQDAFSSDDLIGEAEVSVQELLTAGKTIPLLCDDEDAGMLRVIDVTIKGGSVTPAGADRDHSGDTGRRHRESTAVEACAGGPEGLFIDESLVAYGHVVWDHDVIGEPMPVVAHGQGLVVWDHDA